MLKKLISGGQTGVDRATLDEALELGILCGGWCPRGRIAEDGPIPARYPLTETPTDTVAERTEFNVREADGTLVLLQGPAMRGTTLTVELAAREAKPHLVLDLGWKLEPADVQSWLQRNEIEILNVAGPRESEAPGIYQQSREFLHQLLKLPGTMAT